MLKKWWIGYIVAGVVACAGGAGYFYIAHINNAPTRGIASELDGIDPGEATQEEQAIEEQTVDAAEQTKGFSCREIYKKTAEHKYGRNVAIMRGLGTATQVTLAGSLAALITAQPEIAIALFSASAATGLINTAYLLMDPREARVLLLSEGHLRKFQRLLKKARNIRSDITEQNIIDLINKGIDDGTFCQGFPKLYSVRQVSKYVLERI
jgi:hypothetical protein